MGHETCVAIDYLFVHKHWTIDKYFKGEEAPLFKNGLWFGCNQIVDPWVMNSRYDTEVQTISLNGKIGDQHINLMVFRMILPGFGYQLSETQQGQHFGSRPKW